MKLYVITGYTPDSSSGYFWLPKGTPLVQAAALAGAESTNDKIVRLVQVRVPRKVRTREAIQAFMDDLDADDGFDWLPVLWETVDTNPATV